jgi:hypothetical protein
MMLKSAIGAFSEVLAVLGLLPGTGSGASLETLAMFWIGSGVV